VRNAVRAVVAVVIGLAAVLSLSAGSAMSSQSALRSTSTSVTCPSVIATHQIGTCEAVVTDTDTGTATTPSGTVGFSASTLEFSGSPVCTLSAAGSCQITYTGSVQATATVTASYDGDSSHAPSSATQEILVVYPTIPPPPLCRVPRVIGKTVAQTRRALRHGQCRSGRIRFAFSTRIKKGRVISQRPKPGKVVPADHHKVRLVVSRGKRP